MKNLKRFIPLSIIAIIIITAIKFNIMQYLNFAKPTATPYSISAICAKSLFLSISVFAFVT